MANIWIASDHHIDHHNMLEVPFTLQNGERMRPFTTVEEMKEYMIGRHNTVVRQHDHVYFLGDFAMHKRNVEWAKLFNGKKRLVRGNHDIFPTRTYLEAGFQEIYGVRVFEDIIFSHIPLHPESIKERWLGNVHGHVHNNVPHGHFGPKYYNVCVEMINYTPIALEDLRVLMRKQHEEFEVRKATRECIVTALEHGIYQ